MDGRMRCSAASGHTAAARTHLIASVVRPSRDARGMISAWARPRPASAHDGCHRTPAPCTRTQRTRPPRRRRAASRFPGARGGRPW